MKTASTLLLFIVLAAAVVVEAKPPFTSTTSVLTNLLSGDDVSTFDALTPGGQKMSEIYDRRVSKRIKVNAHVFTASFTDTEHTSTVLVNPEFDKDAAFAAAEQYLTEIGRLPLTLRLGLKNVFINDGDSAIPFVAGDGNLAVNTGRGEMLAGYNALEETLLHEMGHVRFLRMSKDPKWLAVQKKDGAFISDYAASRPLSEDLPESLVAWYALRFRPNQIDAKTKALIEKTMPNRIAFLDAMEFDASPVGVE